MMITNNHHKTMKKLTIAKTFGAAALLGAFAVTPAFALDANSSVTINADGNVRVINAEVTSISGNVINAVTHFKNLVTNWMFTTNASTTVKGGASATSSISGIAVGDKLDVAGILTSFGQPISITASKIVDFKTSSSGTSTASSTNMHKEGKGWKGFLHGLKNGWKDKEDRDNNNKEDRDNSGKHKGFLNVNLHLGEDNENDR